MGDVEEVMNIPSGEVHQLQGKGGSTMRTVAMRSGAHLSIERDDSGTRLKIKGVEANVAKAKRMLTAMLAFNEATPTEDHGFCKCFSSGFCRYGAERCQDGLHSAEGAQKASEEWLNVKTEGDHLGGEEPAIVRPVLLALGCEIGGVHRGSSEGEDEIVDFAVIALCSGTKRELGRFHRFVKPTRWTDEDETLRQKFPADCFSSSSSAIPFTDVLADLLDWLPGVLKAELDDLQPADVLFVGWRDLEMQSHLPKQCNTPASGTVDEQLQNFLFCRWASLADVIISHFNIPPESAPRTSSLMMKHLRLPYSLDPGHRNLAPRSSATTSRILQEILRKGWEPKPTAWRDEVSAPTNFLLPYRCPEVQGSLLGKRSWFQAMGPTAGMPDFMNGMMPPPMVPVNAMLSQPAGAFELPVKAPPPVQTKAPPTAAGAMVKAAPPVVGAMAKATSAPPGSEAPAAQLGKAPAPPWRQQHILPVS